ncbi:MAG: lytic transglycosylase domain-containing protein, partial [Pseudomonas sp.]|nr:lytic transglycosylase domain-containing protein [Pseudomonas sp.]
SVFRLTKQPRDVAEAREWATWFIANGYKFDAGIAQVNTVNFQRTGLTPENMFDACSSIRAGATVLTECYTRASARWKDEQTALRAALSCYQSGNFSTGFHTGYVQKIVAQATAGYPAQALNTTAPAPSSPPIVREGSAAARPVTRSAAGSRPAAPTPAAAGAFDVHNVSSEVPGWGPAPTTTQAPNPAPSTTTTEEPLNSRS